MSQMKKQPSQVDLLILTELDLDIILDEINVQEKLYEVMVQCLDPEDLIHTLPELNPTEDLLQILYVKRNQLTDKIESLIQNN
jgi:hypothetical protein